ncbi:hypothetical protein BD410DRAFT_433732 [Rickenella mellea]|uniref:Uncharacterized protein n=1 Tax=Rickenella mellea TaxID=50990 RepID=A0A4Y7PWU6_9AGAM|nr:hypothetical protein BD410DRAFT_433732 [Rickenella mellea]
MIDLYQDDPLPEVIPPDGIEPGSPPPKTRSATGLAQDAIIVTSQGIADEQSCLRHLLVRRKKISAEMGIKEEDIMDRNTIHLLSCTQPMDKPAFDAFLLDSYGDPKVAEEKWSLFGEQFLNACIDFTLGNRSSNAEATASGSVSRLDRNGIADLHKRFEYKSSDG